MLRQKIKSGDGKHLRAKLRGMGFYISNYPPRIRGGFSENDFNKLVDDKKIRIVGRICGSVCMKSQATGIRHIDGCAGVFMAGSGTTRHQAIQGA